GERRLHGAGAARRAVGAGPPRARAAAGRTGAAGLQRDAGDPPAGAAPGSLVVPQGGREPALGPRPPPRNPRRDQPRSHRATERVDPRLAEEAEDLLPVHPRIDLDPLVR